jgi:hypothetical protein
MLERRLENDGAHQGVLAFDAPAFDAPAYRALSSEFSRNPGSVACIGAKMVASRFSKTILDCSFSRLDERG